MEMRIANFSSITALVVVLTPPACKYLPLLLLKCCSVVQGSSPKVCWETDPSGSVHLPCPVLEFTGTSGFLRGHSGLTLSDRL